MQIFSEKISEKMSVLESPLKTALSWYFFSTSRTHTTDFSFLVSFSIIDYKCFHKFRRILVFHKENAFSCVQQSLRMILQLVRDEFS